MTLSPSPESESDAWQPAQEQRLHRPTDPPAGSLAARLTQGAGRMVTGGMLLVGGLSLLLICLLLLQRGQSDLNLAGSELRVSLTAELEQAHGALAELARHPQLRVATLDGADSEASGRAHQMLQEHLKSHAALRASWVLDDQSRPVAIQPSAAAPMAADAAQLGALSEARNLAQRTMTAGQLQLGWIDLGGGQHWLLLAHPIRFNPRSPADGALVSALDIQALAGPLIDSLAPQLRVELRAGAQKISTVKSPGGPELAVAWPILLRGSLQGRSEALTLQVSQAWWHALAPAAWIASTYLLVGALLVVLVRRRVRESVQHQVAPLRDLTDAAAQVASAGLTEIPALSVDTLLRGGEEVQELAQSFAAMLEQLFLAQNRLEQAVAERTQELSLAKQQLDSTLAGLREGVFSISPDRITLHFASPPVARLLGLPPDAAAMCRHSTDDLLEPESRTALDAAVAQALATGEGRARMRLRRRSDNGASRWLETRLLARALTQGGEVCLDGTLSDISHAMHQREARAAAMAELKLRDRALTSAGIGVWILRVQGAETRSVYANPALAAIVGTSLDELLTTGPQALRHRILDTAFHDAMQRCVNTAQEARLTCRLQRSDGAIAWCDVAMSPVHEDLEPGDPGHIAAAGGSHVVLVVEDVTARRATAAELHMRNRAIDASSNGIVLLNVRKDHHEVVFVNEGFTRMTGYRSEEVLGRSPAFMQGPLVEQPGVMEIRAAIKRGEPCRVLLQNFRKNGERFDNDLSIAPVQDEDSGVITHYVGISSDVTQRLHAERLLRDQFARLNTIFALSPDGFVSFDGQHRVVSVNPAFETLVRVSRTELVGLHAQEFERRMAAEVEQHNPPGMAHWLAADADNADGHTRSDVLVLRGTPRRVVVCSRRNCDAPNVSQVLHLRDITRETEVDRMKSEFLSTAAHELRTPMASIRGFSDLLMLRKFDEERTHDILQTINRQSIWLTDMVNELLDLARIEARKGQDFDLKVQELGELLLQGVNALLVPGDARKVELELPARLPAVRVDAAKLQHALTNVLSNAYKYSPGGGRIRLKVSERHQRGQRQAGISVQDEGLGMRPEHASRAFERFFRADGSGNIPGTGLGLALVKEIVELHGGQVELDSQFGVGTTVTLWLPVWQGDEVGLGDATVATSAQTVQPALTARPAAAA